MAIGLAVDDIIEQRVQRFAEKLAERLEAMATGVEIAAPEAEQLRSALNYVAYAVRETAKKG